MSSNGPGIACCAILDYPRGEHLKMEKERSYLVMPFHYLAIFQVVLASMPDMECGFARDLFLQWCTNPKNSVILTSRSSPGTLARQLIVHQGDRDR